MSARKFAISLIISTLYFGSLVCNDSANMVKYSNNYKFTDGIFYSFQQVKENNPIPKSRIITSVNYDMPEFYPLVLQEKTIFVYDNLGKKKGIPSKSIWGYSKNGRLYININGNYARISLLGGISHIFAQTTTYVHNSPNYYNSYYGRYNAYDNNQYYPQNEMKQYLFNFSTGEIFDYNEKNFKVLLMSDPELYDEYNNLSRRKRKQQMFVYLRKFNERNPVYLPKK